MPINGWLTLREAAEELGITPAALRFAVRQGLLSPKRVNARLNLLSREQVEEYRQNHLRRHGPKRPRKD